MQYSLKRVNKIGAVDEVFSLNVVDDGLAFAWARMFSLGDDVEVWCGARQLATVPATSAYCVRSREVGEI